jgi:hypothetical protein
MNRQKIILQCEVCGADYQLGPHRYEGHKCSGYDIFVCHTCYSSNWDGWGPMHEPKILRILEEKKLPEPKRNPAGWLPRQF